MGYNIKLSYLDTDTIVNCQVSWSEWVSLEVPVIDRGCEFGTLLAGAKNERMKH